MESSIKKELIVQATEKVRVYKENGVTYRANDIGSVTPLILKGLKAGEVMRFDLEGSITKDYQIIGVEVNLSLDEEDKAINILDNIADFRVSLAFARIVHDKPVSQYYMNLNVGKRNEARIFFRPGQVYDFRVSKDCEAVTLWMSPIYVEQPIIPLGTAWTVSEEETTEEENAESTSSTRRG